MNRRTAGWGIRYGDVFRSIDLPQDEDRLHVHDLHATVLYLLGVEHRRLVYLHKGRSKRIDINEGRACKKIIT